MVQVRLRQVPLQADRQRRSRVGGMIGGIFAVVPVATTIAGSSAYLALG